MKLIGNKLLIGRAYRLVALTLEISFALLLAQLRQVIPQDNICKGGCFNVTRQRRVSIPQMHSDKENMTVSHLLRPAACRARQGSLGRRFYHPALRAPNPNSWLSHICGCGEKGVGTLGQADGIA